MRVTHRLLGALAAISLVAGGAAATPILPEGTSITGQPTSLLGYDAGLNDYVSGGSSAVSDGNVEFLTDDFALAIDFSSNGLLRLFDNLGTGDDVFNYTLRFSFAGLAGPLAGLRLQDRSNLTGGDLSLSIIDRDTFELALRRVRFAPGFTSADVAISVDEPSALALWVLGMFGVLATRRRRARADRHAGREVAP
jgi:MYXO-CTERM domain-containing protein